MPSKKKKYNARFPAGRIKKIMQSDEEVGKVAQAVPVIISRTLEMFVCSLLQKAMQVTSAKNAKTLTPTHMKQCILSEQRFDFLKDLVKTVQDSANGDDDMSGAASSQMVSGTNRVIRQRRKSSTKEETVIKKVGSIKEEPIEESSEMSANCSTAMNPYLESGSEQKKPCTSLKTETITEPQPNCSNIHFNPNFYSESVLEQQRTDPLIKTEPITEPLANCTPVHFSPNFYSQSVSEQGRTDPMIKIEPKMEPMANCSTIRFSPNFYSEPLPEQKRAGVITEPTTNCSIPHIIPRFYPVSEQIQAYPVSRTESPTNRSNLRFCPNFYSETAAEQSRTAGPVIKTELSHTEVMDHPHVMANCSTLHFGPSTHSLPVCPPSSVPCQQPARIASLTMDEDYDT